MAPAPGSPPGASAPPDPGPAGRLEAQPLLAGFLAGATVFGLALGAGYLLYHRLWDGSPPILIAVLAVFGAAGGYAAWLLGVLVFSASRGDGQSG